MQGIRIRKARKADVEQIVGIWQKDLIAWHNALPTARAVGRYWKFTDDADRLFGTHLKRIMNPGKPGNQGNGFCLWLLKAAGSSAT